MLQHSLGGYLSLTGTHHKDVKVMLNGTICKDYFLVQRSVAMLELFVELKIVIANRPV